MTAATTARSQVIGAMTMGVGGALMEELAVDRRAGYFVNLISRATQLLRSATFVVKEDQHNRQL
jgi:hypothetical protein